MRAVSKKQARLDRRYSKLRAAFLEAHPLCEIRWDAFCDVAATEVDHRVNRSQRHDLLLATEHWQAACHWCHQRKTQNPAEAHRRGLALKGWEVA